jgi:hypothetical protein
MDSSTCLTLIKSKLSRLQNLLSSQFNFLHHEFSVESDNVRFLEHTLTTLANCNFRSKESRKFAINLSRSNSRVSHKSSKVFPAKQYSFGRLDVQMSKPPINPGAKDSPLRMRPPIPLSRALAQNRSSPNYSITPRVSVALDNLVKPFNASRTKKLKKRKSSLNLTMQTQEYKKEVEQNLKRTKAALSLERTPIMQRRHSATNPARDSPSRVNLETLKRQSVHKVTWVSSRKKSDLKLTDKLLIPVTPSSDISQVEPHSFGKPSLRENIRVENPRWGNDDSYTKETHKKLVEYGSQYQPPMHIGESHVIQSHFNSLDFSSMKQITKNTPTLGLPNNDRTHLATTAAGPLRGSNGKDVGVLKKY